MMKKTMKNALSYFLVLVMLAATVVSAGFSVSAAEADTSWYDVNASTYTLMDEDDLLGLAELVIFGNDFLGKTVQLGHNIELTNGWDCFGTFSGTFDGQGFKISGLTGNTGLFGTLAGGTVKNLRLEVNISSATGDATVGAIAGSCTGGTVENVKLEGSVASATASDYGVGGLFGATPNDSNAQITVKDVKMLANITGCKRVGGLIGRHGTTNSLTVQNTVICATIQGKESGQYSVGGLVGVAMGATVLEDVVVSGTVSGTSGRACGVTGNMAGSLTATRVYIDADIECPMIGAGFVGETTPAAETVTLTDCVFAGNLICSDTSGDKSAAAAFCSVVSTTPTAFTYSFTRCISVGTVHSAKDADNSTKYNAFVSVTKTGITVNMVDCYLVSELSANAAYGSQAPALAEGTNYAVVSAADIVGENASVKLPALDFEETWVTVSDSHPMLSSAVALIEAMKAADVEPTPVDPNPVDPDTPTTPDTGDTTQPGDSTDTTGSTDSTDSTSDLRETTDSKQTEMNTDESNGNSSGCASVTVGSFGMLLLAAGAVMLTKKKQQ